ncbi:UvrD-helicase domain-containing protein [Microgenomates group bacterium]|nr:UvrD-helicase domain-containing protein [Microgenomates group bacterium]
MKEIEGVLAALNDQQRKAVVHDGGTALVLAGAGSGKTKVLTTRAAWLMATHKAFEDEILLVTFTNKAAAEMKRRVEMMVGSKLSWAGTFHSLCARILRTQATKINYDLNWIIFDADDQLSLLKNIYKDNGWDVKRYKPRAVLDAISRAKSNMETPDDLEERGGSDYMRFVARAYRSYQRQLREQMAMDFDDLLNNTITLLTNFDQVRETYRRQYKYLMVDEYQDTNKAQYKLMRLLANEQQNLLAVGDFSQSIYAWRGADYANLEYLRRDFSPVVEYCLEQNYRSTQNILSAATAVISKNTDYPTLKLWTQKSGNTKIEIMQEGTGMKEASTVAALIRKWREEGLDYSEVAILYRTNAQSRPFEESLMHLGIPYRLVGGYKFYERKEVKDMLAYLRILINPQDMISLARVTKIGKRRLEKYWEWRETAKADLPPAELLRQIVEVVAYKEFFDLEDAEEVARWENVLELINSAEVFTETTNFLENVALIQDGYMAEGREEEQESKVTLMSLHSAKGLEFGGVIMVGMEEGLLPHARSLLDPVGLAEERRLCYVGMTRAKERLCLTLARKRWQYGSITEATESRFLADLPERIICWSKKSEYETEDGGWKYKYPSRRNNPTYSGRQQVEKKLDEGRKLIIDDNMLDDLLRDDMSIEEFLRR